MVTKQVVQGSHGVSAERQVLVKSIDGSTFIVCVVGSDTIADLKNNIEYKTHIPGDKHYFTIIGDASPTTRQSTKRAERECVIRMSGRILGGAPSQDDIKQAFNNMAAQLKHLHSALAGEQSKTAELERRLSKGGPGDANVCGLIISTMGACHEGARVLARPGHQESA